jgi:hypothetical protein
MSQKERGLRALVEQRGRGMDKKIKKKLDVTNQKLQQLRQRLAGARQQDDEPGEVRRLEVEIASLESEVEKLKAS